MAFLDDPEFIIAHIRHSCVITDDTGMCEQVIMNEEIENEKAIKQRKKFTGRYSIERDIMDFPTYPQSFDIAISPGISLRNSKTQGKGDRSRRERNAELKCRTVSWKEGENSIKMSAEDLSDVFGKREVKQDKSKTVTVSQLSRQLQESLGKPNNPFLEYSKFEGEAYQGTNCRTMKFRIFLTMQSEDERAIPMSVTVLAGTARVVDLIGLIMYKYTNEGREPPLKNDVKSCCLHIAEDDGEVDIDFPALDNKEQITKFGFTCLALVQKFTSPAKPAPPKPSNGIIVTVHEPQHGFSRVKVDSMNTKMKHVYEKMIKKRGLKRTANEYVLEKQSEPGVAINLESTLESMGTMEFCLVRNGRRIPTKPPDPDFTLPNIYEPFKTYRVSMLQKLRPVTEIQLSVSQERIEIDPVLQPGKAAKKFWGKQKFTSVNMENVVACDLMEEKSNGKAQFRMVYFSQNAREFKHYDFETEANVAGEIVKKITDIIKSNVGGRRSEYLTLKEKKLEKRRSFKY